jgi:transcriptional regulator with XRE-family HTH domain
VTLLREDAEVSEDEPVAATRRTELGAFLRSRRLALDPSTFDLPRSRRHVAGLRREEVAHLAGISMSWYAMLEQGRVRSIGEKTLALRLSPAERDFVADLARSPRAASTASVPDSLRRFLAVTSSPTQLMNARFDLLAWNRSTNDLFGYDALAPPLNLLEMLLFEQRIADRFADRTATLRNMIALLRAKIALVGDDELGSFVTLLEARSATFRRLWAEGRVALEPESTCVVVLPGGGHATYHLDALVPLAAPSLLLIALTPHAAA